MKKQTTGLIFSVTAAAILLILLFQNCSPQIPSDASAQASSSTLSNSVIQILSYPSSQQLEVGHSYTFSVSASTAAGSVLSYQWYRDGVAVAGATTSSYFISSATSIDAATYYVRVTDGTNVSTTSPFLLQVGTTAASIAILSSPQAQTVAPGSVTRFAVAAYDSSGASLTYQWFKNGVAIAGQTASELYIQNTAAGDAGYYAVSVSNATTSVRSGAVLLTIVATTASSGALGGTLYGNHCYLVNRTAATWASAQATCKAAGGGLATITSASENYFVYMLTQSSVWIGATDSASEGSYVLADGTAMIFNAWAAGEPNGGTSENCAQMTPAGYWNDLDCNALRAFVCEL